MIENAATAADDVGVAITLSEKGRCVRATKELKRGTVVSDEAPLVWLKFTDDAGDDGNDEYYYCHRCLEKMRREVVVECEYCDVEKYCSVDCRRLASVEYHCKTGECFAFDTGRDAEKKDPERYSFSDVPNRLAIRAYAKLGGWTGLEKTAEEKRRVSLHLRKHLKECVAHVPKDHNDDSNFLSILCSNTRTLMGADEEIVKEEDFVRAAWALRANAHTLYDVDEGDDDATVRRSRLENKRRKKIGVGLFPTLSRSFNHSCEPNAVFENVRLRLFVRLITDVRRGEEITISYLNDDEKRKKREYRREMLRMQYNFDCDCVKCEREEGEEEKEEKAEEDL